MKLAILGLGSIGRRHLQNFHTIGVETLAGYDASAAQRTSAAAQFPFLAVPSTLEAALESADGVVICTPPDSHIALGRLAVERGAHLMVEKPFAVSAEGLEPFLKLCEEKRRRVLIAHNWRYWPPMLLVEKLLKTGRIGALRAEVLGGAHCWSEVKLGDLPHDPPHQFLGEGAGPVACPESRLHVGDGRASEERGQTCRHRARGVALNDHDGGLFGFDDPTNAGQNG